MIFFTRPISGPISARAVFFFALTIILPYWRWLRGLSAHAPARQGT